MDRTYTASEALQVIVLGVAAAATLPSRLVWMSARHLLDRAGRRGIDNAAAEIAHEALLRSALDADVASIVQRPSLDRVAAVR